MSIRPDEWRGVVSFFDDQIRERYAEVSMRRHLQEKFLRLLNHGFDRLGTTSATLIAKHQQNAASVSAALQALGSPDDVLVVSDSSRIHGLRMPLSEACKIVVGLTVGTIISCVPGVLAYYETEDANARFILRRQPLMAMPSTSGFPQ